jgi:outer membrane receptor protein involved in Fe transport
MRSNAIKRCLWPIVVAGQLAWPTLSVGAAAAGDADTSSGALEEVVVTATRRSERLQDVPISVTAFSQEKMDAQGLRSIDDVTRLTPGVAFSRNGTGSSANYNDESSDINIRGIDSAAGASTTGIYINDTPIQSRHIGFGAVNAFPALFDLDHVEVLRGPQGTLFGAGAEGGVVRFLTPSPTLDKDSGYLRSELGTTKNGDASYELGAAIGGPIIDNVLGFRVSASFRRDGGYVDRVAYTRATATPATDPLTPPTYASDVYANSNWQQTTSLRGELKWAVNDAVSVSPSFYYQELHINDTAIYWPNLSDPGNDVYRNGNRLSNPSTDPFWLAAIKVDWDLGFGQFTSNTSYYSRNQHSTSDYTQYLRASFLGNTYPSSPLDEGYAPFRDKQNNFYQEIRIASKDTSARVSWNAGLFYAHMNENVAEDIYDPTIDGEFTPVTGVPGGLCGPNFLGYPCPNGLLFDGPVQRVVDKQIAVFGEVGFKFTDTLKLTLGVRGSKVDYDGISIAGGAFTGGPTTSFEASGSEKPVTPKGVFAWQPDHDNMFYVSAAKGYRVGGVNVGVGTICNGDLASIGVPLGADGNRHVPGQYQSDSLWSYEIGGKNSFLDHRLQIDSSFFVINWKNIQQNVYLPSCGEQFVANLGQVQSRGGDIDVQYRPIEPLTLGVTVAYTDARFTKSSCAGVLQYSGTRCVDPASGNDFAPIVTEGNRLLGAPWSFVGSAEYVFAQWRDRAPYVRADFQYQTAQTALLPGQDVANGLNDTTIPGLPINRNLNLRGGMRWDGIDVSVFANNVTDTHPQLFLSRDIAADFDQQYFARGVRPRTVGVTATYRY